MSKHLPAILAIRPFTPEREYSIDIHCLPSSSLYQAHLPKSAMTAVPIKTQQIMNVKRFLS
jgi:hypothetical protein